jgi:predicted O-methyltransferase YrrM
MSKMTVNPFDGKSLDTFEGMISASEAELLHSMAANLKAGSIVEIGSWRGKSAIALALGARTQDETCRPMIYCVEPHAEFVGVYGGRFGARDRRAFFEAVLRADCAEGIALLNLPSTAAARAWTGPIGLLFIDGDHSEPAVQSDLDAWASFVVDGGYIAFDDALDSDVGPARVIARLLASGAFTHWSTVGKVVVLQKTPDMARQTAWQKRKAILDDLGSRAEAAGYERAFSQARLAYATFLSTQHKYMYVETPKAACTSWKRLIAAVEEAPLHLGLADNHRETRNDMLIHQRHLVGVPTIVNTEPIDRDDILSGSPEWLVFALSRDPFSRLVSVFENKVRTGEPGYRAFEERFGDRAFDEPQQAFAAFVREVVAIAENRAADAHLRDQSALLMPNLIPYRRIFKLGDAGEAVAAFAAHIRALGYLGNVVLERRNVGLNRSWRDYYDAETAELVVEAYREDFEQFGYDIDGWMGGTEIVETSEERRWRAEVVERNGMIDRLYDELAAARSRQ